MRYEKGTKVKVVDSNPEDETFDIRFSRKVGTVVGYSWDNTDPNDPMHIVEFETNQFQDVEILDGEFVTTDQDWLTEMLSPTTKESFWYEELKEVVYSVENPEEADDHYTKDEILELCTGNSEYADILLDRLEWQHPSTLIEEDLIYGEIEEKDGTYALTGGEQ